MGDVISNDDGDAPPTRCISFTVKGPWAHFRRIEGNIVKQTYRIMPRTTVAGLIAAILGIERDGYYELFRRDRSAIAIEPARPLRTMNMPMNTLSTAHGNLQSLNGRGKLSVKLPDPTAPRQQHNYEVLVDPAYRIDLALDDDERYLQFRETLNSGHSYYVPSLGLSEHLAEIEYHGEFDVNPGASSEQIEIDSAIPDSIENVVLEPGVRCEVEESPAFMTTDGGGRITTDFTSYTYSPEADTLQVCDIDTARVDGRTVAFV